MVTHIDLNTRDDLGLAERAAAWLSVVKNGGHEERVAFAAWLRESPRHVEEALFAAALSGALENFDRERRWNVEEILAQHPANVLPLEQEGSAKRPSVSAFKSVRRTAAKPRWLWGAGLAAAVVAAVAVWRPAFLGGWQSYTTGVGEQRVVELEDGSLVHLNTQSRVDVRFTDSARELRLIEGEALFDAQQDPLHPFRVFSDRAVIQAVGTRFNVYRREKDTTVSVLEGLVRIDTELKPSLSSPAPKADMLASGERARITEGRIVKHEKPDATQLATWRQRRLVFQADTLEDIAAEFNRYNRSPKIRIEGAEAKQLRFTGMFDADDPRSLVQLLGKDRELIFEQRQDELLIKARPTPDAPNSR